jgi:RNA polymerase sigma-70 factor (ECF subfamily)
LRLGRRPGIGDAELADGLVANEDWAVTEVWHRFAPMVLGTAQRTLGSTTDAEDVAQDVFCCALEKITTLRAPDKLRSFIYGIANHALKAALRRRKRQRLLTPLPSGAEEPPDSQSAEVESRDVLRRFDALLSRLGPRHRLIFVLRRLEALTTAEVAAAAHVSNATVKRAVAYASRRLSCWIDTDPELAALLNNARARGRSGGGAAQAFISVKIPLGREVSPKSSVGAPPVFVTPAAVSNVFSILFTPETEPSPPLPS